MDTMVLKFGGSSIADNEKLNIVAEKIITVYDEGHNVVVVVSAQGKTTDFLLSQARELDKEPNKRELDSLLSTGEQISAAKLCILLNKKRYKAVSLTGWQAGIFTDCVNQNALIESIDTRRIEELLNENKIVVICGFQGINSNFDITTLGRGGSDTTAVCLAKALGAEKCLIYSDVDGVFSADPKCIKVAKKLSKISYDEMINMSNEGAKVLHNRCVKIAKKYKIPIIAKSTFKEGSGTVVEDTIENKGVKGLVKNIENVVVRFDSLDLQREFIDLYKLLVENDIFPLVYRKNGEGISCTIKSTDRAKFEELFYKNFKQRNLDFFNEIRVSIVGYEVESDLKVLAEIVKALEADFDIYEVELGSGVIRIKFKEHISEDLLKQLHDLVLN